MVRIKVCGITNATDAQLAVKLGVDALGFNFYQDSSRYVSPGRVRAIVASLPPFVVPVALFVDENPAVIKEIASFCGISTIQLHGDETPGSLGSLSAYKVIKGFRIRTERDLLQLRRYTADAFLLDAYVPGVKGGTGSTFDWRWAQSASAHAPIILAGGLTPDNVIEAIRIVHPYAVDVCSGVESRPGKKDGQALRQFISAVRAAE